MAKFTCKKCKKSIHLDEYTISVNNGELVVPQAFCKKCEKYMEEDSKFNGWGKALMRPGGKVRGRYDN
tara:strand:+ start:7309 stop:7512 length:204 start_codon:yes stop_codon:yes gene_type:complete